MTSEVQAALIGAVSGAAFGALASLLVNSLSTWFRIKMFSCKLHLEPPQKFGVRVTSRVFNAYDFPMNDAIAYITVYHQKEDVRHPPNNGYDAFIKPPDDVKLVREERLCWSINENPYQTDIYAGERQGLDLFEVGDCWIEIPSENGWGAVTYENGRRGKARVFLNRKKYEAEIKIVSKDTKAKKFKVVIDPDVK